MHIYSVRDLSEQMSDLIRDAESGQLSIVTRHGKPVFIAVPFDEVLLKAGIWFALAIKLYTEEIASIGMAAKIAGCSTAEFTERLNKRGIRIVNYSPEELQEELK